MRKLLLKIRTPENTPVSYKLLFGLLALGCVLGLAAQYSSLKNLKWLIEITQSLGFWTFFVTMIACFAKSPKQAFLSLLVFLFGMISAYYALPFALYRVFGIASILGWSAFGAAVSVFGTALWYARGTGKLSALLLAAPFTLLCAEIGYVFLLAAHGLLKTVILGYVSAAADTVFFAALIAAVPVNGRQRVLSLAFTLPAAMLLLLVMGLLLTGR